MANFAGNYGWPFVAAANYTGIVKNAQGGVIQFLPTVSGTMTLYDAQVGTGTAFLTAFPVTAGQPVVLAAAFANGLFATLAGGAAGTFIMS